VRFACYLGNQKEIDAYLEAAALGSHAILVSQDRRTIPLAFHELTLEAVDKRL
jgi:hypothetical protein